MSGLSIERGSLAAKVRLPGWYRVVWTVAVLVLIGRPLVDRWFGTTWAGVVALFGLVGVLVYEQVLRITSGVAPSRRTMVTYPSARVPGLVLLAVVVVPLVVVMFIAPIAAAVAAVLTVAGAIASAFCVVWMTAGIRRDIAGGRANAA